MIAGVRENGQAVVGSVTYPTTLDGRLKPTSDIREARDNQSRFLCAGQCEEIEAYKRANPNWPQAKATWGELAVWFVQMAIHAHPDKVGDPISLLVMDKAKGLDWRQSGVCPT